jgi:hypothetical protein
MSYLDISPPGYLSYPSQQIYKKAFNNARAFYGSETVAHQLAWSAVEKHGALLHKADLEQRKRTTGREPQYQSDEETDDELYL